MTQQGIKNNTNDDFLNELSEVNHESKKENSSKSEEVNNGNQGKVPSIEIDVSGKKEEVKETKTKVTFGSSNSLKDYVKKSTPTPPPNEPSQEHKDKQDKEKKLTVEQYREQLKKEEKDYSNQYSVEDFQDLAEFGVELIDMIAVFAIRIFAKDDTDAPYQIPISRKNSLTRTLTKILIRAQMKFPLGILFFVGLVVAYATPFKKAKDHRKFVDEEQRKLSRQQKPREYIKEKKLPEKVIEGNNNNSSDIIETIIPEEVIPVSVIDKTLPKRPGRPKSPRNPGRPSK